MLRAKNWFIFLLILIALFALILGLLPFTIKKVIEIKGTEVVGAAVELKDVDINYWPVGISLNQLQVTDPASPMQNLLAFDLASVQIDALKLLDNAVVIQNLQIHALSFDTPRSSSGAIDHVDKADQSSDKTADIKSKVKQWANKLPDIQEILAKEDLETDKRYKALAEDYENRQAHWQTRIDSLPSKKDIDEYQQKINALKSKKIQSPQDIAVLHQSLRDLKEKIKDDQTKVQTAKRDFLIDKKLLMGQVVALKDAPARDFKQLTEKYSLDMKGAFNLSDLLLGKKVTALIEKYAEHLDKFKPIIDKLKGDTGAEEETGDTETASNSVNLRYEITKGLININTDFGQINTDLQQLSWPLDKQVPGLVTLTGMNLKNIAALNASIKIDGSQSPALTQANYTIDRIILSPEGDNSVNVKKASLSVKGQSSQSGMMITSNNHLSIDNLSIQSKNTNPNIKTITEQVNKSGEMTAELKINGQLPTPSLSFSSNLDGQLASILKSSFNAQKSAWKNELEENLNNKLDVALKRITKDKKFFDQEPLDLNKLNQQLSNFLSQQINSSSKAQQDKIKKSATKALNKQLDKWL